MAHLRGFLIGIAVLCSASLTAGTGLELKVITAVVIGGASLAGGRGTAWGTVVGAFAFAAVTLASPFGSTPLFCAGVVGIGFGAGLFSVGTLSVAMALGAGDGAGLVLGAWGAVQATAAGTAVAFGGILRDVIAGLAERGALGPALTGPAIGYTVIYHLEIVALFLAVITLAPLVLPASRYEPRESSEPFGLAELPG